METIYLVIKILHIIAGATALIVGPFAMFRQDGSRFHRNAGKIYFRSMMVVVASALFLSIYKDNMFLLMVAFLTFYLITTAFRSLKLKKLGQGQQPLFIDWLIFWVSAVAGLFLLVMGIRNLAAGNSFGIVSVVFGSIMIRGILRDYKRLTGKNKTKNLWLFTHIRNMIGGYIATFTAFLVQNVHTDPAFIVWLAPAVGFTPIMIYTLRKFIKRTKKGESLRLQNVE